MGRDGLESKADIKAYGSSGAVFSAARKRSAAIHEQSEDRK